jgi:hypothetical protein
MSVYDESSWRITYDTACAKMGMVELYVKLHIFKVTGMMIYLQVVNLIVVVPHFSSLIL